jgi:hypothetical protein
MKYLHVAGLLAGLNLLALGSASAQMATPSTAAGPLTRAEVKMERDEFLKSHRWDEQTDMWVLKSGYEPPAGVMSRDQVKAQRDVFLSNNRWDESAGSWVPMKPGPRVLSTLTREQVKAETVQFLKTHRWDESSSTWLEKNPRMTSPKK